MLSPLVKKNGLINQGMVSDLAMPSQSSARLIASGVSYLFPEDEGKDYGVINNTHRHGA